MTPEGRVKNSVKEVLKAAGAYWHCPVQNGMGAPSLDFVCCFHGWFFAIETKADGKQPTPRQKLTIEAMEKAGAKVFIINEVSGMDELKEWLYAREKEANTGGTGRTARRDVTAGERADDGDEASVGKCSFPDLWGSGS